MQKELQTGSAGNLAWEPSLRFFFLSRKKNKSGGPAHGRADFGGVPKSDAPCPRLERKGLSATAIFRLQKNAKPLLYTQYSKKMKGVSDAFQKKGSRRGDAEPYNEFLLRSQERLAFCNIAWYNAVVNI